MNNSTQQQIRNSNEHIGAKSIAKKLWVRGESIKHLRSFTSALLYELAPKTSLEIFFAKRFVIAAWKLQRAEDLERGRFNYLNQIPIDNYSWRDGAEPEKAAIHRRVRNLDRIKSNDFELLKIQKEVRHLDEAMHRAFEKLKELQKKHI